VIARVALGNDRKQPFYNLSEFSFEGLLGDSDGIANNLRNYINGFSPKARDIFEKVEFDKEIDKLEESNRLYLIVKDFCSSDCNSSSYSKQGFGGFQSDDNGLKSGKALSFSSIDNGANSRK